MIKIDKKKRDVRLGSRLRGIAGCDDEDGIHGYTQQHAESKQVVYRGKADPVLPFVDGLRRLKPEVVLHVPDGEPALGAQLRDAFSRGFQVDGRKVFHFHRIPLRIRLVGRINSSGSGLYQMPVDRAIAFKRFLNFFTV